MKNRKERFIIVILLVLLLLGAFIYILAFRNPDQNNLIPDSGADDYTGNRQTMQLADGTPGIAIPGQSESLVFAADQTTQQINIYDPSANDCFFLPSLYVDGVKIWQGGYLAPGKAYYTIVLDKPLQAGKYDAYIFYECYKEDGSPLNNAKVQFTLIVE